ncbi:MAG TPA: hypothetical protein VFX45_11960 [Solirubrobacterales bacterium]|nr:hypothetical protein [Solirubrobacterales bacterium]
MAAIAVPIVAAFRVGGGGVGVAAGALVTAAIIVIAVRQRPLGPIGRAPDASGRRRLLLVVDRPLEDPVAIAEIATQAEGSVAEDPGGTAEVLVLAPARIGFLDRWASDLEGARRDAQQRLVVTVASLAKAGIAAEARVGDEDPVQAVEDAVGSFAATEVVLVTAPADRDPAAAEAAAELERRLRARFRRLVLSDPPAG